jgi:hypothetical protein
MKKNKIKKKHTKLHENENILKNFKSAKILEHRQWFLPFSTLEYQYRNNINIGLFESGRWPWYYIKKYQPTPESKFGLNLLNEQK